MSKSISECLKEIESLKKELVLYKNIVANLPCIVFITEAWFEDGMYQAKLIYCNNFGYDITGYTKEEVEKMGVYFAKIMLHPDDYETTEQSYHYLCLPKNSNKSFTGPYRFKFADGEYHWGIGCVRILKPVEDCEHRQFVNCVTPLTEAMRNDFQIQMLIAKNYQDGENSQVSKITAIQMETLKLIGRGYSIPEIAVALNKSEGCISSRIQTLMNLLELHTLSALACFAHSHGVFYESDKDAKHSAAFSFEILAKKQLKKKKGNEGQ